MTAVTIIWDTVRKEVLAEPEVKAEYNIHSPEFNISATVVALRDEAGLTQREFAAKVGMKQSQLARIETGRQVPKLVTLAKLASVAGYEVEVNLVPIKTNQKEHN